jgi:uncharacterized cofD-like protein
MKFSLRRRFGLSLRAKLWAAFLLMGLAMTCLAVALAALATVLLSPTTVETIRTFPPAGLGLSALTALLLGGFWLHRGFKKAFAILAQKDFEASERLRALVFHKGESTPHQALVALGGGTGLSSLLKGLKEFPVQLSAIVTVTDDGGSSGRLRQDLQILPPGDIRNCLVALSRSESLLSRLFQFRFDESGQFSGHSFGNLFIAAMTSVLGDFGSAVREASNILAIRGNVVPVTLANVSLIARFRDGAEIAGETAITAAHRPIASIALHPPDPSPNPEALSAIDDAHMIVLGPGSLFTSVIPNLLVPGVADHINASRAKIAYVCNVMSQPGETDRFTAADHVAALLANTPLRRIDVVVVNSRRAPRWVLEKYEAKNQFWVPPTVSRIEERGIRVISGDFLQDADLLRHNPTTLAQVLMVLMREFAEHFSPATDLPFEAMVEDLAE